MTTHTDPVSHSPMGPMEKAIRKWDGDVYAGHEPECWADLRMIAISQDAIRAALVSALKEYGEHHFDCQKGSLHYNYEEPSCTCGYDAAIAKAEAAR